MLKKKIIANSIHNLTDARYFAGWMVDYFVFNIDPTDPIHIKPTDIGICQTWVEGPQFYLQLAENQYDQAEKYAVDLNCSGIFQTHPSKQLTIPHIKGLNIDSLQEISNEKTTNQFVIYGLRTEEEINAIVELQDEYKVSCFVDYNSIECSNEILVESDIVGIQVHGGPEEKVGFKSYDELDELFELLQDF